MYQEENLGIHNYYKSKKEYRKAMRSEHLFLKKFIADIYVLLRG